MAAVHPHPRQSCTIPRTHSCTLLITNPSYFSAPLNSIKVTPCTLTPLRILHLVMLRRSVLSNSVFMTYALPARRSFVAAAAAAPSSTRHARNLNATSIDVKPDFSLTSSAKLIEAEQTYSAHNYHPLPVVFSRAQGVHVWDPEGKRYFDFLSAYSSVNQGHSHPAIVAATVKQMQVPSFAASLV